LSSLAGSPRSRWALRGGCRRTGGGGRWPRAAGRCWPPRGAGGPSASSFRPAGRAGGGADAGPTLFIDGVVRRGGYDPPTLLAALAPWAVQLGCRQHQSDGTGGQRRRMRRRPGDQLTVIRSRGALTCSGPWPRRRGRVRRWGHAVGGAWSRPDHDV